MPDFFLKSSLVFIFSFALGGGVIFSRILVIALSARMLSQLVRQAGFEPVAVDCFGDQDTRESSLASAVVGSLALVDIKTTLERLQAHYDLQYVVYGSGFECHFESLAWLQERFTILGNSADLFARLQHKPSLFERFAALSIPFPLSSLRPPANSDGWLVKPVAGAGGYEIAWAAADFAHTEKQVYWQRYQEGLPMSVLFAATENQLSIFGFNRQYTLSCKGQPFVFAGVDNHAPISPAVRVSIEDWLRRLLTYYPMRGLGSMDFVIDNDQLYILEINARIPASAQLYGQSIFMAHWQACLGLLPQAVKTSPSAYRIIFADGDITIPPALRWPKWALDRPVSGAFIGEGQPVCSIIASGTDAADVAERLRCQLSSLKHLLQTGLLNHAIPGKR